MTKRSVSCVNIVSIVIFLICICPSSAHAQTACDSGTIKKIESYMNSIRKLKSNFIQTDNNGLVQEGMIFLSKPNHLKWEYISPKHILILVNSMRTTYYDYELDERNDFWNKSTVIDFLVRDHITIKDLNLKHCNVYSDEYEIIITPHNKENISIALNIIIQKNPLRLKKFLAKNMNDGISSVIELNNIEYDPSFDNRIFAFSRHK